MNQVQLRSGKLEIKEDTAWMLEHRQYNKLIAYDADRIEKVADESLKMYDIVLDRSEVLQYARIGYFYSCKHWKRGMDFDMLSTFWMRMYIFQEIYIEHYFTALPIDTRIKIAKLYDSVLKNLDEGSGKAYFNAIYNAADDVGILTDTAVELMYMLTTQTLKEKATDDDLEKELQSMYKWTGNLATVPMATFLMSMEAKAKVADGVTVTIPFSHIKEKFEELITSGGC